MILRLSGVLLCLLFVQLQTSTNFSRKCKTNIFFLILYLNKCWLQGAQSWFPFLNPPLNSGGNPCWQRWGKICLCWAFGTPIIQAGQCRQEPNLLNCCLLDHLLDMIYTQVSKHPTGELSAHCADKPLCTRTGVEATMHSSLPQVYPPPLFIPPTCFAPSSRQLAAVTLHLSRTPPPKKKKKSDVGRRG